MTTLENKNSRPKYSFDNFVVGKSNQLAHGVSVNAAEHPGTRYNPLFIYGGAGLGKTHLMKAIAHHITSVNKKAGVIYVTCEEFLNEMMAAIQKNKIQKFRKKYREADALLMDDMQFISGKGGMQEEITHTFKHLLLNGKQIAAASNILPEEITDLNEELKTLICGGIVTDIQPPELELKMAFIQEAILRHKGRMSASVIKYMAQNVDDDFRRIEGMVIKIIAVSEIQQCKISKSLIKQAIYLT